MAHITEHCRTDIIRRLILYVTDITGFLIGSPYLNCEGVILHKVAGLPLKLNGRYSKTRKTFFVEDYEIVTRTENDVVNLLSRFEIKKAMQKKLRVKAAITSLNTSRIMP